MKKTIFILFATTLFSITAKAQAPSIFSNRAYGGTNYDAATCIAKTNDGGYVIAGSTYSSDGDLLGAGLHGWNGDCMVIKLSAGGVVEWSKAYGGFAGEIFNSIKQTSDGGYIAAGITNSLGDDVHTGPGGWVVKLAPNGDIQWQVRAGNFAYDAVQTTDGGYAVGGDNYIMKFNPAGILQWTYNTQLTVYKSLCPTADGGCTAAGEGNGTFRAIEFRITKLSSSGVMDWEQDYGGTGDDNPLAIKPTSDGGYIVAGCTSTRNDGQVTGHHGQYDFWVIKLSSTFVLEWAKALGGSMQDIAYDVIQTNDGGYVVVGETYSFDGDVPRAETEYPVDGWVVKLSSIGNLVWQQSIGGSNNDHFRGIVQNANGSYTIVGFTSSNTISGFHQNPSGSFVADAWFVNLASDGNLAVDQNNPFTKNVKLYPNPATENIYIDFDQEEFSNVSYQLFDNQLKIIQAGTLCLNKNEVNLSQLPQATYFIRIQKENENPRLFKIIKK